MRFLPPAPPVPRRQLLLIEGLTKLLPSPMLWPEPFVAAWLGIPWRINVAALLKSLQRKIQDALEGSGGASKASATPDMKIGDRVIHNNTQRRGTVTEVQKFKGGQQQVTVQLDSGEFMKLLDHREFSVL
jgi:hypothetical protein